MPERKIFLGSIIFLFVVIIGALTIVVREGDLFPTPEEPTFISYIGFWDPEIINPLKIEFQRQNPSITIEYEQKNPGLYFETLQNLISSKEQPDIFWWHSGWGPTLKNDLASLPEDILSTSKYEITYYPVTAFDAKIGGTYRGVPLEIDGLALIYNKQLLASSKLDPPKTWSDLERFHVKKLNKYDKKLGIVKSAIALGTTKNITNFSDIVGMLFLQNRVVFVKDGSLNIENNVSIDGENLGQRTLDFYASFVPKVWNDSQPNSIRAFTKGKVAMILLPANKIPSLQSQIKATGNKVKFGVANVPQPPEATPVTWASYWLSGVSVESTNQREAWEFIKFLGEPENLRKIFTKEKEFGSIGRPYPRKDMETELRSNKLLSPYVAQAKYAKSWYFHSGTNDDSLNDENIEALAGIVVRMSQGKGSAKNNLRKLGVSLVEIATKYGVLEPSILER